MTGETYHPRSGSLATYREDFDLDVGVAWSEVRDFRPDEQPSRTAFDIEEARQRLVGFDDEELRRIRLLAPGCRLERGATYIDLHEPNPHEFTALSDMESGPENWFVPKSAVDYPLWNRLVGFGDPTRPNRATRGPRP